MSPGLKACPSSISDVKTNLMTYCGGECSFLAYYFCCGNMMMVYILYLLGGWRVTESLDYALVCFYFSFRCKISYPDYKALRVFYPLPIYKTKQY